MQNDPTSDVDGMVDRCQWCEHYTPNPRRERHIVGEVAPRIEQRCDYCEASNAPEPWVQISAAQVSAMFHVLERRMISALDGSATSRRPRQSPSRLGEVAARAVDGDPPQS